MLSAAPARFLARIGLRVRDFLLSRFWRLEEGAVTHQRGVEERCPSDSGNGLGGLAEEAVALRATPVVVAF